MGFSSKFCILDKKISTKLFSENFPTAKNWGQLGNFCLSGISLQVAIKFRKNLTQFKTTI